MPYAGSRLEAIEVQVKALMNDDSGRLFSQSQFVAMANDAKRQIAQKKLFRQEGTIDAVAGTWSYDFLTALDDFVDVHACRWTTADYPMEHLRSMTEFDEIRIDGSWYDGEAATDGPAYWYAQGRKLFVWPAPEETTSDGIVIQYSYMPADFDIDLWHATSIYPVWTANTLTEIGAFIQAVSWDGYIYECTARSGDFKTHATTQPVWSGITTGQTIVDDMVTWTKRLYTPNYTPEGLPADDSMYVEWILFRLFQRKGNAPGAAQSASDHKGLFTAEVNKALTAYRGPRAAILPYR
jgi:hypothetical protein